MTRHSWRKIRTHCYVCRKCGLCRENKQDRTGGWFTVWYLPDGSRVRSLTRPACERGPLTDKRLAHYFPPEGSTVGA